MAIFKNNSINPDAFYFGKHPSAVFLKDLLVSALHSQSPKIESAHLLIALAKIPGGLIQKELAKRNIAVADWEAGLSECVGPSAGAPPPAVLTRDALSPSGLAALEAAERRRAQENNPRITEAVLLDATLQHLSSAVIERLELIELAPKSWRENLDRIIRPRPPVKVFDDASGAIVPGALTPAARKILRLLRSETEALGYPTADPRHLLAAFLAHDGGALVYGLHLQAISLRGMREALTLALRPGAKRTRVELPLDRDHFQPLLIRIFELAGEIAGREGSERIDESHLVRAFLEVKSTALRILTDYLADPAKLAAVAEHFESLEEDDDEERQVEDIETVRSRLKQRVVGQDDAIERVIPYIQRLRFGFRTPGRPLGVFLFCGQSGSGKTEMAKELARAVFGSEENLIFLEMGQFNSPESMNIFVGAPPGYVGFGEGKLTNGLREKPRAVVLFDEVEKAHSKVLDALLRFLDEGRIDDPAGPVRDGSECLVILTSNVGAEELSRLWREAEENPGMRSKLRARMRDEFRRHNFRVEFLNRVDEHLLFRPLGLPEYTEIARRRLRFYADRLHREHDVEVLHGDDVAEAIGAHCDQLGEGARAVSRLAHNLVVTPVIDYLLRGGVAPPCRLSVRVKSPAALNGEEPQVVVESA